MEIKFTKQDLIYSRKYQSKRDVLEALLSDKKTYTFKEVEKILNDFLKKGV